MKGNRFNGEVVNVECTEKGFCRIRVSSPYSNEVYEAEIAQVALELINHHLEKVKETNSNYELLTSPANIYLVTEDEGLECFEVVFTDPVIHSMRFACHSVEKI